MALVESHHEMILGSLPVDRYVSPEGWRMDVLADGLEPGSPEAVMAVQASFVADGSRARRERMENATTGFRVMISGPTHDHLVMGEDALALALPDGSGDEPTPFIWAPSDGVSAASVRDVVHGRYEQLFDDLDEIRDVPRRIFALRLTHLPYVRPERPVALVAPPVDPASTPTPRQRLWSVAVAGTVRTPAEIHVHPRTGSTPLGYTIVQVMPAGSGSPDLWPHRASGPAGSTTDRTAPMGARQPLHATTPLVAEVPAGQLGPSSYTLAVLIDSPDPQTILLRSTVSSVLPSGASALDDEHWETEALVPDGPSLVSYHATSLPSLATTSGKQRVMLTQTAGAPVAVIGWYALRSDDNSALFAGHCGQPHLWLDARKLGPRGRVWLSATSNRGDGYHMVSQGDVHEVGGYPRFVPPGSEVFVAAAGVDAPAISASYYPLGWYHARTPKGSA